MNPDKIVSDGFKIWPHALRRVEPGVSIVFETKERYDDQSMINFHRAFHRVYPNAYWFRNNRGQEREVFVPADVAISGLDVVTPLIDIILALPEDLNLKIHIRREVVPINFCMMPHKGAITSLNRVLPILAKELGVFPPSLLIEKQFTDWSIDFFSKKLALSFETWWDTELGAYIFKSSDFVHPEVLIHETKPINHAPRLDLEKYKDIKPDIKLHPEKLISQETFSENHFLEWRLRRQTSVVNLSSTRQRI